MHACCQSNFLHVSFQPKFISQVSLRPKGNSLSLHFTNFLPFRYFVLVLLYIHESNEYRSSLLFVSESRWLIESSAQFFAGAYDPTRYYRDGYTYTTVNPHLALWQHYAYEVTILKCINLLNWKRLSPNPKKAQSTIGMSLSIPLKHPL